MRASRHRTTGRSRTRTGTRPITRTRSARTKKCATSNEAKANGAEGTEAVRISRKAEYALRALVALARHGRPLQIGELSRVENIPVKFLEQILLALRNDGFLASKRGVGGGYALK